MTRNNSVNFTGPLQYPIADAATDLFKKEDVQVATKALDLHDHTTGKGLPIPFATAIPNGTITSAMIADGTIDTVDLKDGSVTSAKIADGTIATADHAAASITNALLAADTARANLLTNGGFEVWQRGNGPFTGGNYGPDRWFAQASGGDTISVTRTTGVADVASTASAAISTTHSAGFTQVFQQIKTSESALRQKTVTFSIRAWSNAAAPIVQMQTDGTGGATTNGTAHSGNSQWQTLSVTAVVPGDATIVTVYVTYTLAATAYLDNAMLVVGSQAADYAPLHPADDLARCLRYYEVVSGFNTASMLGGGQAYSTTAAQLSWPFRVRKAVAPTITSTNAVTMALLSAAGSALGISTITALGPTADGTTMQATVGSGLVAGNCTHLIGAASQTGALNAEANP